MKKNKIVHLSLHVPNLTRRSNKIQTILGQLINHPISDFSTSLLINLSYSLRNFFLHSGHSTSLSKNKLHGTSAPQCGHFTTSAPIVKSYSMNSSNKPSGIIRLDYPHIFPSFRPSNQLTYPSGFRRSNV